MPEQRIGLGGHNGDVNSAVFSPDGACVVTASVDGTARVWRADGAGEPVVLRGHNGDVMSAVFSSDGARVVTASMDGTVRVWRADGTGEPVVLQGHDGWVTSAVFSPDGTRVVTKPGYGTPRVWSADGMGKPVVLRGHHGQIKSAAFSPDGARVVTAAMDGTARVWRVDWYLLLDYLRAATTACLAPNERRELLGESAEEAQASYESCERRHGRTPLRNLRDACSATAASRSAGIRGGATPGDP